MKLKHATVGIAIAATCAAGPASAEFGPADVVESLGTAAIEEAPKAIVDNFPKQATSWAQRSQFVKDILYKDFGGKMTKLGKGAGAILKRAGPVVDVVAGVVYVGDAVLDGDIEEAKIRLAGTGVRVGGGLAVDAGATAAGAACGPGAIACAATTIVAGDALVEEGAERLEDRLRRDTWQKRIDGVANGPAPSAGRGGPINITAKVDQVTAVTKGNDAKAAIVIGFAEEDNVSVNGQANRLTAVAQSRANAEILIAGATGSDAKATGIVKDATASAGYGARASIKVAVVGEGGKSEVVARGDLTAGAGSRGDASIRIGVVDSGSATAVVNDVYAGAGSGGSVEINIASGDSGRSTAYLGGDVYGYASRGRDTSITIADNSSVYTRKDIYNYNGDLTIGSGNRVTRKGRRCITIDRGFCVWRIVPRSKKHGCPPRYKHRRGMCYLYSDYQHRIR